MSDIADDIKTTTEAVAGDVATIIRIEEEKASLGADDPRMVDLADQAEQVAVEILQLTRIERELVAQARAEARHPETEASSR